MNTGEKIREFIITQIAAQAGSAGLEYNQSLFQAGILDSMSILKLVSFIETEFHLEIGDEELVPENFETISDISRMIEKKQNPPSPHS
jgi:acyl carrier protein